MGVVHVALVDAADLAALRLRLITPPSKPAYNLIIARSCDAAMLLSRLGNVRLVHATADVIEGVDGLASVELTRWESLHTVGWHLRLTRRRLVGGRRPATRGVAGR